MKGGDARRAWALAVLLVSGAGMASCSLAPSDKFVEAMSKDTATVCGRIHAIYGIGNGDAWLYRSNITNGTVTCDDKGMTISSTPPPIPVGVQLVPLPKGP